MLPLRVEALRLEHAELVYPYLQDERLYAYMPGPAPASIEALRGRFQRWLEGCPNGSAQWCNWISFVGEQAVGTLQATIEQDGSATLGYVVFRPFWGRGIAKEGRRWLLEELFARYRVERVYAYVDTQNTASIRVAQAAGLRLLAKEEASAQLTEPAPVTDVVLMARAPAPRSELTAR